MTEEPATHFDIAAEWFLRLRAAPANAEVRRDCERWLDESPSHRIAFQRVEQSWQLLGTQTEPAPGSALPRSRPARIARGGRATHGRWRRRLVTGVAVLAACIALIVALPAFRLWTDADYVTQTGMSRSLTLADGTRIDLGPDSALAVDMTENGRQVRLLSGEAFFEVAPDPSRPFVLDAGGVDITVLGTAFNVRLSSTTTDVELAHGAVQLTYPGLDGGEARLAPGQVAQIDREAGTLVTGEIAAEDIAAWRSGRLFVQDVTIGSVVEQIRRYHHAWIALPDGTLAAQRVTGLYDLTDPDRALRALIQPHGGKVHAVSSYVRVLGRL